MKYVQADQISIEIECNTQANAIFCHLKRPCVYTDGGELKKVLNKISTLVLDFPMNPQEAVNSLQHWARFYGVLEGDPMSTLESSLLLEIETTLRDQRHTQKLCTGN